MNFFYNNLGIRDMIIYFCFVLIDLVNNYKNVYSHNDNVCLGVRMFFMRAVSILYIVTFNIIFSMKSDIRDVWGTG